MKLHLHRARARSARLAAALIIAMSAGVALAQRSATPVSDSDALAGPAAGVPLSLANDAYDQLAGLSAATLHDFVLPTGEAVVLDLHAKRLFSDDAVLVVGTDEGDAPMPMPEVAAFSGTIVGESGSRVYLAITPDSVNGFIERGKQRFLISSGPVGASLPAVIYDVASLPDGTLDLNAFQCHVDELADATVGQIDGGAAVGVRDGPCRVAEIAIETDYQFRQIFGNNSAASAYAAALFGAVSEIYERDINTEIVISYLRIWSTSADPWTGSDTLAQLYEFRDYWVANMGSVQRDIAHFLSGRALGGGIAWVGVVCNGTYGYAVSGNIQGSFPYPLQDNSNYNWDVIVSTHELGHNFGAPHTHSQTPQVDNCAGGDCSVCPNGTLMSYCHTCPGGLTNMLLQFHTQTINSYILPFLDTTCDITSDAPTITDNPDGADVCNGAQVTFNVAATADGALSYQWRHDTVDIPGATGTSYTIDPADVSDAGSYDCVISSHCGTTTSAAASLTVCDFVSDADLNGDCSVDLTDLGILLGNYGQTGVPSSFGDLSGDTNVDLTDLGLLLGEYNPSPC